MANRSLYGGLFAALAACQPQSTSTPLDSIEAEPAQEVPSAVTTSAPAARAAPAAPLTGCDAAFARLRASLRVGMRGVELRDALAEVAFVYREQMVMDNHHLTLPTVGQQAFQFGCIDEPVDKFDVALDQGEGPVPATRFFMRVVGAERSELKSFLASTDAKLLEMAIVQDSPEERMRDMLSGLG